MNYHKTFLKKIQIAEKNLDRLRIHLNVCSQNKKSLKLMQTKTHAYFIKKKSMSKTPYAPQSITFTIITKVSNLLSSQSSSPSKTESPRASGVLRSSGVCRSLNESSGSPSELLADALASAESFCTSLSNSKLGTMRFFGVDSRDIGR